MVTAVGQVWSAAATGCFRLSNTQMLKKLTLSSYTLSLSLKARSAVSQRPAFPLKLLVEIQLCHYTVLQLLHAVVKHPCEPTNSWNLSSKQVKTHWACFCSTSRPAVCVCVLSVLMCFDLRLLRCVWFPCHLELRSIGSCQHGAVMKPACGIWWCHYL